MPKTPTPSSETRITTVWMTLVTAVPQIPPRDTVGGKDRGGDEHALEHGERCQRTEYHPDHVSFDHVDDHVLGLDAEAREPLAPPGPEPDGEELRHRLESQPPVINGEEHPHERHGGKAADTVPPHVPDATIDHGARDSVRARAADASPRQSEGHESARHATPRDGPFHRAPGSPDHEGPHGRHPAEVKNDRRYRNVIHWRPLLTARETSEYSSNVEPHVHDITVGDDVVLPLDLEPPRVLHGLLGSELHKNRLGNHFRPDEAPLEIRVNAARGRAGTRPASDCPGPHFVFADRKKRDEVQKAVRRADEARQRRLAESKIF